MKVTVAMLADFALAHNDRKLYITGGGIHELTFGHLPGVQPRISIALEVEIETSEQGIPHTVLIEASDPSGRPFIKPEPFTVALPTTSMPPAGNHVPIVYNMLNLTFHDEGDYTFSISVDGQPGATLPLRVSLVPGSATELSALLQLLQQGFTAFTANDLETAEHNFRAVIEAMPSLGVAHNNLGFVLLATGRFDDALAAFNRAGETGFDRLELLQANIACCHYFLGNPAASLALFEGCLNARAFSGPSILHGISGDGLFLVSLPSAGAYTQLMALNAAWSATRAGKTDDAHKLMTMAQSLVEISADQPLTDALGQLEEELASAGS